MARRKNRKTFYNYQCTLTGETFTTTREASKPEELVSVKAYYELHQDEDDRPEVFKTLAASQVRQIQETAAPASGEDESLEEELN